jgi:hypothetical protein
VFVSGQLHTSWNPTSTKASFTGLACLSYNQGWPEPYVHTMFNGKFGNSLPKIRYIHRIYIYIYGSGQPYIQWKAQHSIAVESTWIKEWPYSDWWWYRQQKDRTSAPIGVPAASWRSCCWARAGQYLVHCLQFNNHLDTGSSFKKLSASWHVRWNLRSGKYSLGLITRLDQLWVPLLFHTERGNVWRLNYCGAGRDAWLLNYCSAGRNAFPELLWCRERCLTT